MLRNIYDKQGLIKGFYSGFIVNSIRVILKQFYRCTNIIICDGYSPLDVGLASNVYTGTKHYKLQ